MSNPEPFAAEGADPPTQLFVMFALLPSMKKLLSQ
jgi:hypothetical protein